MTAKQTLSLTKIYDNKRLPILIDKTYKLDVVRKQRAVMVPKVQGIELEVFAVVILIEILNR